MPFTAEYLNASFGSSRTGIGTVGLTLMKNDGTVAVARTQTGVVEEGGGVYGKASIAIPDDAASIKWDTGGGTPLYAAEDLEPARKQAELEAKLPTNNIMGSAVKTDKDDEIDAILADTAAMQPLVDVAVSTRESTTAAAARETAILAAIAALNNISIADVQTALTNQGYTSARAAMIELSKKMLINRLELADGDTGNWKLYDDNDTDVLLTFSVTNKNAGAIDLPTAAPAQRTRGI